MKVGPRGWVVIGLGVPVAYGIALYVLGANSALSVLYSALTLSFLAGVPFAVGYLTILPMHQPGWVKRITAPWVAFALILLICFAAQWEGTICIVMALPWLMAFSSLGGVAAALVKESKRRKQVGTLVAIAPLIAMPIETRVPTAEDMRSHTVAIEINAVPRDVWEFVVSVDSIRTNELGRSLYRAVGFPAPIAATLDYRRVGGVRRASFERGVVFTETVVDWVEQQRLHFTIEPNTAEIPRTALDPHVTVGGAYFDVLTGTYELRALGDSATRLTLTSHYRVSTHFNRYSNWWADRIMASVQSDILRIHKTRAESNVRVRAPSDSSHGAESRRRD
ncbi:MAG TPA: SRPBCC family protein [Gemmatimonadaceae bacterium]|nr:SRPBCC family protein [Gemmatimonadaceae bacterium]